VVYLLNYDEEILNSSMGSGRFMREIHLMKSLNIERDRQSIHTNQLDIGTLTLTVKRVGSADSREREQRCALSKEGIGDAQEGSNQ